MRKIKLMYLLNMLLLIFAVCINTNAAEKKKEEKAPAAAEKKKAEKAPELTPQDIKRQITRDAKAGIDNSTWKITLTKMTEDPNKRKTIEDTIYFRNGKVESEYLIKNEGFTPTNFTVRLKEDNTIIWETMQTSASKGLAFWRGEIKKNRIMRGALSWHVKETLIEDYSFISEPNNNINAKVFEFELPKEALKPIVVPPIPVPVTTPAPPVIKPVTGTEEEPVKKEEQVPIVQEEPKVQPQTPVTEEKKPTEEKPRRWKFPWQR